jgi:hypothetical protein
MVFYRVFGDLKLEAAFHLSDIQSGFVLLNILLCVAFYRLFFWQFSFACIVNR